MDRDPVVDARDLVRDRLPGLLDDLEHSRDEAETLVLTQAVWFAVAELACDARRYWRGGGKWIVRELNDADPAFAGQWIAAYGDRTAVRLLAEQVLGEVGGPLFAGFRLAGERPEE